MEGAGIAVVVILCIVVAIGAWMFSMSLDKSRITEYVHRRGGRVVSISYAPFGKGWFGEKEERIYEVVYYDHEGQQHFATCKTSMWSGVFCTDDRVTHRKSKWYDSLAPGNEPGKPVIGQIPPEFVDDDADADELRRLREENARLRAQLAAGTPSDAIADPGKCPACGAAITPGALRCPDCRMALR